ncbi:9899_t:CDS:2 [Ambispora leptoticha]|uniref:9899_t:CDS:1 n=1 Tax=Ambispora leptoticha TaxID=144679 RepID=A0A9N9CHK2_9GLOM|nr:9899_t:CDS:2 [Ambispora leptoticha]
MGVKIFQSIQEELEHYKARAFALEENLTETQATLEEFQQSSRELEEELERELEQSEKRCNDLKIKNEQLKNEVDEWKQKYYQSKSEANISTTQMQKELDNLRSLQEKYMVETRELELYNDELERTERAAQSSLMDLESKYNKAIERNVLLENELEGKNQLIVQVQRLKDELRDINIEMAILKNQQEGEYGPPTTAAVTTMSVDSRPPSPTLSTYSRSPSPTFSTHAQSKPSAVTTMSVDSRPPSPTLFAYTHSPSPTLSTHAQSKTAAVTTMYVDSRPPSPTLSAYTRSPSPTLSTHTQSNPLPKPTLSAHAQSKTAAVTTMSVDSPPPSPTLSAYAQSNPPPNPTLSTHTQSKQSNPVMMVQEMVGKVKSLEARLVSCRSLVTPLLAPPPSYSATTPPCTATPSRPPSPKHRADITYRAPSKSQRQSSAQKKSFMMFAPLTFKV